MASPNHNMVDQAIIDVLNYFDIFRFPLHLDELHSFLRMRIGKNELESHLESLVREGRVFKLDDCFSLKSDPQRVENKRKGFIKAQQEIAKGRRIAKLLMSFPFVRMVAISGSLSKGYAGDESDIDFFIITDSSHLWTSRTLLHLLKKASFLVNAQHSLCMNYFIADEHLKIEEQNYFTAIELSTLIPVSGGYYYQKLLQANTWIEEYLPNVDLPKRNYSTTRFGVVKRFLEKLLSSGALNTYFFNLTDRKWRRKWRRKGVSDKDYELAFKTKLYVSKNHPDNTQKVVLEEIERRSNES